MLLVLSIYHRFRLWNRLLQLYLFIHSMQKKNGVERNKIHHTLETVSILQDKKREIKHHMPDAARYTIHIIELNIYIYANENRKHRATQLLVSEGNKRRDEEEVAKRERTQNNNNNNKNSARSVPLSLFLHRCHLISSLNKCVQMKMSKLIKRQRADVEEPEREKEGSIDERRDELTPVVLVCNKSKETAPNDQ